MTDHSLATENRQLARRCLTSHTQIFCYSSCERLSERNEAGSTSLRNQTVFQKSSSHQNRWLGENSSHWMAVRRIKKMSRPDFVTLDELDLYCNIYRMF